MVKETKVSAENYLPLPVVAGNAVVWGVRSTPECGLEVSHFSDGMVHTMQLKELSRGDRSLIF